jgi:YfiH family protein
LIEFSERVIAGHGAAIHDGERLFLGYTSGAFPAAALRELFPSRRLLFLKQVHSDRILDEAEWRAGAEADGLLLRRPGPVAVIQTADCLPLFFFKDDGSRGGVVHVGWRGLLQGIEQRLLDRLEGDSGRYGFFLGPAIEPRCYEVGEELPRLFAEKPYANDIFAKSGPGRYRMDLRAGVTLSLAAAGVAAARVQDCGLCTFCSSGRFPSYRRDGPSGRRIYNFLQLKGVPSGPA